MGQTIEKLKGLARDSWSGEEGERRAERLEKYLRGKLAEYHETTGIPQEEILNAWERDRTYSAINYYQESNQPSIKSDKVRVFETIDSFRESVGEKKFRCPACSGVSTDAYEHEECGWKVYGLLGDMGKGVHVFIKERMQGHTIFMPLSWEEVEQEA